MSTTARLLGFGTGLAVLFGVGALAGDLVGPAPAERGAEPAMHGMGSTTGSVPPVLRSTVGTDPSVLPGLAVSQAGYTLDLQRTSMPRGRTAMLRFRILGADGAAVRRFAVEHTKRMHLVIARRDLTGFQHLHPAMAADGTWSTPVRIPAAGSYRVFADFDAGGAKRTLGADLAVDGAQRTTPLPVPATTAATDGYRVTLAAPGVRAGRDAELRFTVTRGGRPVAVQPYLGARGHLVALRAGDLAYLHVHPGEDRLQFMLEPPSAGRYRLFLQFRHDGSVHTAPFTLEVQR